MSEFGNDRVPSTPELCMQTIEDYSQDKFSKVEAIRSIFAAFYESADYQNTPSDELNVAIGTYLAMFDQHDASRRISAERGTRYAAGPRSEYEDEDSPPEDRTERP